MKKFIYFFCFLFFVSIEARDQLLIENKIKNEEFLKPIICSKDGISFFLKEIYNNHEYKNFLSSCLIHIIDFIENAQNTLSPQIFTQKVLNIFIQKIYETSFINPFAFLYFLQQSQNYMTDIIFSDKLKVENEIFEIIQNSLVNEFDLLKENSKEFITKCSKKILEKTEYSIQNYLETQNTFNFLIEILASKVLFDIEDCEESWECFKNLTSVISYFYEIKIITNENHLQRIIWALCAQFSKSLEIQIEIVNLDIKDFLKKEIQEKMPLIFSKEEIENNILSKKNYLLKKIDVI